MQKRLYGAVLVIAIVLVGAHKVKVQAAHEHEVVPFDFTEELIKNIADMNKFSFKRTPEKRLEQFYDIRAGLQRLRFLPMREREEFFRVSIKGDRPLALLIKRLGFLPEEVDKAIVVKAIELLIRAGDQFLPRELQDFADNAVFAPKAAVRILNECEAGQEACGEAMKKIKQNFAFSANQQDLIQEPHYNMILEYLDQETLKDMKGLIKALHE